MFSADDIQANRLYFQAKLRATRQITDVVKKARGEVGAGDFLLLDVRDRASFTQGHIRGALCAPLEELEQWAPLLPRSRALVAYCWNHT